MTVPAFAPLPTSTKTRGMVGGAHLTFLLPGDVSPADIRFLRAVWSRFGGDPDADINWVTRWEDVVAAPSHARFVVSFGKGGVDAWHRWGVVRVSDHSTMFHRPDNADGYWIMVCEHPHGVMQQTAWGHGVKENIIEELHIFTSEFDPGDYLGTKCLQCAHARVPRRVEVQHYLWEADGIALCEDHWRKRANIKIVAVKKKRVNPSSVEAQIDGQMEMAV